MYKTKLKSNLTQYFFIKELKFDKIFKIPLLQTQDIMQVCFILVIFLFLFYGFLCLLMLKDCAEKQL